MSDPQSLRGGRYVLSGRLGEGGMATVYRAFDTRLQRWRAIKVLLPAFATKKKLLSRFEAEAQTMALLEHPHIVRVYDVDRDGDFPFIVMELVEGGSLSGWLEKNGAMPARMAVHVTVELCQALQYAHDRGIIHRDIKPHNVLIDRSGVCRLTDFGIARAGDDDSAGLTKTGAVMGTWGFMAPEQRTDAKHVDVRADIYAVAATLYSLITDKAPMDLFASDRDASILDGVPEALLPILVKASEYKREMRHASARELAADLLTVVDQLPAIPSDTPPLAADVPPPRPPPELSREGSHETILPMEEPVVEAAAAPVVAPSTVSPNTFAPTQVPSGAGGLLPWAVAAAALLVGVVGFGAWWSSRTQTTVTAPTPIPVVAAVQAPVPDATPAAVVPAAPAVVTTEAAAPMTPAPKPKPVAATPAPVATPAPAAPAAAAPVVAPPAAAAASQCIKSAAVASRSPASVSVRADLCREGKATLHYRIGDGPWYPKPMSKRVGAWFAVIDLPAGASGTLAWYVTAEDQNFGSAGSPKTVALGGG